MSNKGRIYIPNQNMPRICPELAAEIGLNESILLLQLDYWIAAAGKERDGRRWVYESLSDIQGAFPFWSRPTINRALHSLEEHELIVVGNYNRRKADRTRWFALNYETIAALDAVLVTGIELSQNETGLSQNDTTLSQNETTLPHDPNVSPHENTAPDGADSPDDLFPPVREPPPRTEPSILEKTDPLSLAAAVAARGGGEKSWTVTGPEGVNPYEGEPLAAMCELLRMPEPPPPKKRDAWVRRLEQIGEGWGAGPQVLADAIRAIRDSEDHNWRSFSSPFASTFEEVVGVMITRVRNEEHVPANVIKVELW